MLFRLRNLKFLDCYEVTKEEKEMILQDSLFYDVIKAKDSNRPKEEYDESSSNYTPLPNKPSKDDEKPQGI